MGFHFIESEFTLKLKLKVKDFTKQTLNVLMLIISELPTMRPFVIYTVLAMKLF